MGTYKKLKNGNYLYNGEEGVFRTIGGKRIFIKDGQDLASAMKDSGKFKNNKNQSKDNGERKEENDLDKESKKANNSKIETISREDYDKMSKDYKGTLKDLVNTAEFRGENKEELIKSLTNQGFDIENDKTILKLTDKGTTLVPVKVAESKSPRTYEEVDKEWQEVAKKIEKDYDEFGGTTLENERKLNQLSNERDSLSIYQNDANTKKINNKVDKEILEKHDLADGDPNFKRRMLSRMESDIKYYLGNGNGNARHLWAPDEDEHIQIMKSLYNTLPDNEKPEWLTMNQINDYEKQMKEVKGNSSLISRYAGTIDYMKNSTGLNMSQILEIIKKMDKDRNK